MKFTNYLNPTMFYEYLDWLVRLDEFHLDDCPPPMSANQFYFEERMGYDSGLRVTERINLIPADFDLDHRILTIRNPKSNKGGVQKTTILPYDVKPFERFISKFSENERMFPVTRSTIWRYAKNAGRLGGLNIFEAKDEKTINGIWTHLLRSSCAKMYINAGASESLVARKLRHSASNVTQRYTKVDLQAVLDFDEIHFQKCLAVPTLEKREIQTIEDVQQ